MTKLERENIERSFQRLDQLTGRLKPILTSEVPADATERSRVVHMIHFEVLRLGKRLGVNHTSTSLKDAEILGGIK